MDDQSSPDFLKDSVMQQEDSGSETDEELASKVAVEHNVYHMLFDTVGQCESGLVNDESDFVIETERPFYMHSGDAETKNDASEFDQPGACQLPEPLEDMEFFSGPAEWRQAWEWEVGKCSRMTSEQNAQQFFEPEICTDSSESVADDTGSDCVDDIAECHIQPCLPCRTRTVVDDSDDMATAVSASLVVNEPVYCSQSAENNHAGTDTVCDSESCDSTAIQCVMDDIVNTCVDEAVTWDSADESGITELDKQDCATQFSHDFADGGPDGRVLSTRIPSARTYNEHQDHFFTEDRCTDTGFAAGFAASSVFAQRSSYSSGAQCRPMDSKWNPPRTPPTSESDCCRWKPKKKSWRKNSAGNAAAKICDLLTDLGKD